MKRWRLPVRWSTYAELAAELHAAELEADHAGRAVARVEALLEQDGWRGSTYAASVRKALDG